ncbi:hypothetical protein [Streptomyces sp. 8N706]|uniref:hypothetical protein n=1 Tax=Streptomyces sp. 8N706 TaxID=3457416 RepID=UPI003FD16D1D
MLALGHEPATVAYADDTGDTLLWKVGDGKGDDNGGDLLPAGRTGDSTWKDIDSRRLLEQLAPGIPPGHRPVCAQAMPGQPSGRSRVYCSQ